MTGTAAPTLEKQFDLLIARFEAKAHRIEAIEADRDERIQKIRQVADKQLGSLKTTLQELALKIFELWQQNEGLLTRDGKDRSHQFPAGSVGKQLGSFQVEIMDEAVAKDSIRRWGRARRFLRIKVEINRQAILDARESDSVVRRLRGLIVGRAPERFQVKPKDAKSTHSWTVNELLNALEDRKAEIEAGRAVHPT